MTWCSSPTGRAMPTNGSPGSPAARWSRCSHARTGAGVVVHGLVWRSHLDQTGFFATENRHLGEQLQQPGRRGAARHAGARRRLPPPEVRRDPPPRGPGRDVAFVGGIDVAHNRRDDAAHQGDPQPQPLTEEYGPHPPWHDVQVAIQGPAVHDVETVFRERWGDPAPLSRAPWRRLADRARGLDSTPDPPSRAVASAAARRCTTSCSSCGPTPTWAGAATIPSPGVVSAASPAATPRQSGGPSASSTSRTSTSGAMTSRGSSRSSCGGSRTSTWSSSSRWSPTSTGLNRVPQLLGRHRAIGRLMEVAPGRVAAYGLENHADVPVYVHAKVCIVDDTWASTGSDNFSRRSWTHDSELTAVVLDESYARDLRLTLAAEHLDRLDDVRDRGLEATMGDCLDPADMFEVYADHAARLDAWLAAGSHGSRPPGRLRRLPLPQLTAAAAALGRAPARRDPRSRRATAGVAQGRALLRPRLATPAVVAATAVRSGRPEARCLRSQRCPGPRRPSTRPGTGAIAALDGRTSRCAAAYPLTDPCRRATGWNP